MINNTAGSRGWIRRKRPYYARSKTGCLTCKIRHVKCDENKPSCQACLKFGVRCDWKVRDQPMPIIIIQQRELAPKRRSSQTISHQPCRKLFQSEQEQQCFRIFCDKISRELSGLFESSLWSRIVLQACETEPGIRHIVVAIGALGYTSQVVTAGLPPPSSTSDQAVRLFLDEAQKHHQFALSQYGIAIRMLRKVASERKSDVRTMLLGCVLTACFETFHGDHQSAIAQIQSGLNLIEDWYAGNPKTKKANDLLGTTSPSPFTIEDELMQALGRLDIQAMSFLDPRDEKTHDRMRHYGQSSIDNMPTRFRDVGEARVYLELVMRRFMHFVALIQKLEGGNGCLRHTRSSTASPFEGPMAHLEELEQWHRAFSPLLHFARRPKGRGAFLAATALEMHYLCSYFVVDLLASNQTKTPKSYTPLFKEVLSLCSSYLEHPDFRHIDSTYRFDLHIITPLYVVGRRCRHSGTRRAALALLLSTPRREGVWDGILAGKIVQWVIDVEEEDGLQDDGTPIAPAILNMSFDFDLQARRVHVECLQPKIGSDSPVERDVLLTW